MKTKTPQLKVRSGVQSGGGYVNGVYYPDQSGVCSPAQPTPTPPQPYPPYPPYPYKGGYVNGVFYPDQSGYCG